MDESRNDPGPPGDERSESRTNPPDATNRSDQGRPDEGLPPHPTREEELDKALKDTFPSSDPVPPKHVD